MTLLKTDDDPVLAIPRMVLGVVIFLHGAEKMLGWFGGAGLTTTLEIFTHHMGIPFPLAFLAIAAEFFGGLGLIIGLLSRIAALGIAANMIVAIATVHARFGVF